jgi:hypothetical protein
MPRIFVQSPQDKVLRKKGGEKIHKIMKIFYSYQSYNYASFGAKKTIKAIS